MKILKNIITLLVVTPFIFSCSKDDLETNNLVKEGINQNDPSVTNKVYNSFKTVYSTNSLVVKFEPGVSDSDKDYLRSYYEVLTYELCEHCANNEIELWTFGKGIDIEPKKTTIDDPSGGMHFPIYPYSYIEEVDYQFDFQVASANTSKVAISNSTMTYGYHSYIKPNNDGVTIAVFDTGINPDTFGSTPLFDLPFLYNASNDGIPGIHSGWDFVNHDDDCYDDNLGIHGTAVTSIITDILNSNQYNIPHQILPLKVCNADGIASYFDFLCALNYALPRAEILHMSLGWYDSNSTDLVNNIFLELMSDYPNVILINSAGNDNNNNDNPLNMHLPSGYPLGNIFAIASCNESSTDVSIFSNYGKASVDFFAVGEYIPFLGTYVDGTSFAAPKVTAMVAKYKFLDPGASPSQILQYLVSSGVSPQGVFNINKPVKFNSILYP